MRLPDPAFWRGRRVLVTGHTGFKGSWLSFWLAALGADVVGYALPPVTEPSLFELLGIARRIDSRLGDLRDPAELKKTFDLAQPDVVLHLAAQALVPRSYRDPAETFESNVLGTVNVLEAVRHASSVRGVVVVTSDKVYAENAGRAYVESDPLGGHDPYAASKACAEIVAASYRASFLREQGVGLGTVRAGNVIGGGDWSADRLIPDVVAAMRTGTPLNVRHPGATRPWQHVLDPLAAYLLLAERLVAGDDVARAWNVGPDPGAVATVGDVTARFERAWGGTMVSRTVPSRFYEAPKLTLDATAAREALAWTPRLDLDGAIGYTAEWYRAHAEGASVPDVTSDQIARYTALVPLAPALPRAR